jgi:tetratricopeptide (TPR) repeat protein
MAAPSVPPKRSSSPPADRRGTAIGRYVVLDLLAQGGMGMVYSAFDAQLDRKVAIKVLHSHLVKGDDAGEVRLRLLREAQAMARLSHPNVVAIHDVGVFEESVFLAMEFVEGGTLTEWLRTPRNWRERLEVLIAAGRGLAAAHAAGLVHRDFKPDNVLVGHDGRVRVTDFGIVHVELREGGAPAQLPSAAMMASGVASGPGPVSGPKEAIAALSEPTSTQSITDGGMLGTVGYMAPEQVFEEPVDARTDQFSFCATLYYALYGKKPFADDSIDVYVTALSGSPREPPPGTRVPSWVWRALARGLSHAPGDRFPSMGALLAALQDDPAVRRRKWLTIGAVALLGVASIAGLRYAQRRQDLQCAGAARELAGVWDEHVKDDVRRAFTATGAARAGDSADRVTKILDAYADGWTGMARDTCESTFIRKDQPADVLRMRDDCLEREKTELRALTTLFRRADGAIVESSVKAAYGLTAPSWCADVNSLRASAGLPVDPAKRAVVLQARAQLAEAKSLFLGGKYKEALPATESGLATARSVFHTGTEAEALYLAALLRERRGNFADAESIFGDSLRAAYAAGDDAVVVRAASELGFIIGDKLYRPREAQLFVDMANGGLARIGESEELEAEAISVHAILPVTEGHPELAVPLFERAIRTLRRTAGVNPIVARRLNNLGYAYHVWSRHPDALTVLHEARSMYATVYGLENEETAVPLSNIGASELGLGRFSEADAALAQGRAVFERENPEGFWSAWVLQYVVLSAFLQGDLPRALATGRRSLDLAEKLSASLRLVPGTSVATADVLLAMGDAAGALPLCDRAIEVQERVGLIGADRVYEWDALRCRGEALTALGRADEAVAPLERSLSLERRVFAWDLPRTKFALARALAAGHGDRARAKTLAEEARDGAAAAPVVKPDRAAVEQWLAALTPK